MPTSIYQTPEPIVLPTFASSPNFNSLPTNTYSIALHAVLSFLPCATALMPVQMGRVDPVSKHRLGCPLGASTAGGFLRRLAQTT